MKKKYLLPALLLVTTILSANPDNVNAHGAMDIQAEESMQKTKPLPPKTIEIKQQEFRNLNKLIAKVDGLSEREKQNRAKLAEAKLNYKVASDNFHAVLEIKTLTENMHREQDCYLAYYRIKDLDKKIRVGSADDMQIYNEIKAPLQRFLANCRNLRLDLLKKYKNQ